MALLTGRSIMSTRNGLALLSGLYRLIGRRSLPDQPSVAWRPTPVQSSIHFIRRVTTVRRLALFWPSFTADRPRTVA